MVFGSGLFKTKKTKQRSITVYQWHTPERITHIKQIYLKTCTILQTTELFANYKSLFEHLDVALYSKYGKYQKYGLIKCKLSLPKLYYTAEHQCTPGESIYFRLVIDNQTKVELKDIVVYLASIEEYRAQRAGKYKIITKETVHMVL